ncbi:MAG: PAS domain-containing protein, partial [Treponema sp.]|nr:PAS domain-containing protein [Treponema sp.]
MVELVTTEETQVLNEENAALRLQVKKLTRQLAAQQNTMMRFEKVSALRDGLSAKLKEEQTKQEKFMNMMLENSSNAIILLDGEGRFAYCTDTFLKMAGIQNFGLVNGLRFSEVFKCFNDAVFSEHAEFYISRAMEEQGTIKSEETLDIDGSGNLRIYTTNTTAMRDKSGK